MDAAHAQLWVRLHRAHRMLEQARMAEALAGAVTLLMQLRAEHAGEEALMAEHRYPKMSLHRAAHTLLESEFSRLTRAIRDAGQHPPDHVRVRLVKKLVAACHHLIAHTAHADISLAHFVLASASVAPCRRLA